MLTATDEKARAAATPDYKLPKAKRNPGAKRTKPVRLRDFCGEIPQRSTVKEDLKKIEKLAATGRESDINTGYWLALGHNEKAFLLWREQLAEQHLILDVLNANSLAIEMRALHLRLVKEIWDGCKTDLERQVWECKWHTAIKKRLPVGKLHALIKIARQDGTAASPALLALGEYTQRIRHQNIAKEILATGAYDNLQWMAPGQPMTPYSRIGLDMMIIGMGKLPEASIRSQIQASLKLGQWVEPRKMILRLMRAPSDKLKVPQLGMALAKEMGFEPYCFFDVPSEAPRSQPDLA